MFVIFFHKNPRFEVIMQCETNLEFDGENLIFGGCNFVFIMQYLYGCACNAVGKVHVKF